MDSYYNTQKLYKNYSPKVLFFDEFKSVKSADGAISFHICNGKTGQTIDIVETNSQIIIDTFHLVQLISRLLNKSRTIICKVLVKINKKKANVSH